MKASSTFVEEAFFVSSASKTVFSNALGNEKIPMLIKALESFHPLHVGPIWISNPRYTYARGNEKSPMLTRALESFHPLHVDLVWIIHPSKKGWITLRNERIDWAWMIAAGRWKKIKEAMIELKEMRSEKKYFRFAWFLSIVDSFSQNQKGLFIKYTWKSDSFDSVYVINNLFSPFLKIGENRRNTCLPLFFFSLFTTNPIFV